LRKPRDLPMASIRPHSLAHGHTKMAAAPLEVVYAAVARTPRQKDPGMAVGKKPRGWPKKKGKRKAKGKGNRLSPPPPKQLAFVRRCRANGTEIEIKI